MRHGSVSEEMPASTATVFDLLHNYDRRLEWDTLLSAAYLSDGHTRAGLGATTVCVGRSLLAGIALKTVYVTFDRPRLAAVKMVNSPPLFASWAASIRHDELGPVLSRLTCKWSFEARPRWLAWLLEPLTGRIFHWETRKRLRALRDYLGKRTQPQSGDGIKPGASAPGIKARRNLISSEPHRGAGITAMASTLTNLLYHIVFSTKQREPIITAPIRPDLYAYIGGIIRGEGGALLEVGGMPDHVHLVTRFRSEPSDATMLKTIKSKSSQWLNDRPNRPGRFQWQTGYGAFTVSASQLEHVRTYVRNQEQHHGRKSFQEELRALLERHGVEYDERYIWD